MKSLTPAEASALRRSGAQCSDGSRTQLGDDEREIYRTLIETGRAVARPCGCHGIMVITTTKEGHEALRLWRELRALQEREQR